MSFFLVYLIEEPFIQDKYYSCHDSGAPIFVEPPIGATLEKGKLARLTCYVQGDPFPEVTWLFEDVPVVASDTTSFR